jgi:hypothetical protein
MIVGFLLLFQDLDSFFNKFFTLFVSFEKVAKEQLFIINVLKPELDFAFRSLFIRILELQVHLLELLVLQVDEVERLGFANLLSLVLIFLRPVEIYRDTPVFFGSGGVKG